MAYQKLNVSRALRIVFSDTVPIPNIATNYLTSVATATTANKLVDSAVNFTTNGAKVGDIIYNTTDNTAAKITAIDSATTLSVSADIFATGEAYKIFSEQEKNGCLLMVNDNGSGTPPSVRVKTAGGDVVVLGGVQDGQVLPINIVQVYSTGTDIVSATALW